MNMGLSARTRGLKMGLPQMGLHPPPVSYRVRYGHTWIIGDCRCGWFEHCILIEKTEGIQVCITTIESLHTVN